MCVGWYGWQDRRKVQKMGFYEGPVVLTDGIFETGAYWVPSKSQNPTILGFLIYLVLCKHQLRRIIFSVTVFFTAK